MVNAKLGKLNDKQMCKKCLLKSDEPIVNRKSQIVNRHP